MADGKLITLGDDLAVYATSAIEARFIYDEVFRDGCYDVGGLPERPFVVDVGANIGIFLLYLARHYPEAEFLAFEPMPRSADLLRRNLAHHGLAAAVAVHEVGLGRVEEAGAAFTYYPMVPGNSTRHPETKAAVKAVLAETVPDRLVERMYRGREVSVDIARLARFLPAGRPVDLLKVDVEGAEVDVLLGIDPGQWPLIHRVVMEVHDEDGRLAAACDILRGHGLAPAVRPALPDPHGPAYLIHATRTTGR